MNININTKSRRVDIRLNKNFYSINAVRKASNDFKNVCDCSILNKKDILISLRIKNHNDVNKIGYEFCNYVLGLMKNEALV